MSHTDKLIATDIESYLEKHLRKDLLRFLTCGSVDNGKSTLIGRLLYDSKLIYEDQLAAVVSDSRKFNTTSNDFDLSLLVDGLQAEREQGITIDVAYRYFSTDKRKFIIADSPGHEQYTRNMLTGASNCDLAIVIVDASQGIQTQTKRHSYLCSLIGIKHIIVAVNKMDLVNFDQSVYRAIKKEYKEMSVTFGFKDVRFVPVSALDGDNVVTQSKNTPWYPGSPLMRLLETIETSNKIQAEPMRFPVQYVNRPNSDFRGYCGTVKSGTVQIGDKVTVLPSNLTTTVKSILSTEGETNKAYAGEAITLLFNDELDISRGCVISSAGSLPEATNEFQANVVWFNPAPLRPEYEYMFKFASKKCTGKIQSVQFQVDVNSLERTKSDSLFMNDIGSAEIKLNELVAVDSYTHLPGTGSFIVIDRMSKATVGAGMVTQAKSSGLIDRVYSQSDIDMNQYIRKHYPEWGCLKI